MSLFKLNPGLVPGFRRFRRCFFGLKVTLTCTIEPNFSSSMPVQSQQSLALGISFDRDRFTHGS